MAGFRGSILRLGGVGWGLIDEMFSLAGGIGHEQLAFADRRLAHQRITEPFLPDCFAGAGVADDDGAAFGVVRDVVVLDDGGGGSIIGRLHLPDFLAGCGVEGIERVRAITAADEQHSAAVNHGEGGRSDRAGAGDAHGPCFAAIFGFEGDGLQLGQIPRQSKLHRFVHVDFDFFDGPGGWLIGGGESRECK